MMNLNNRYVKISVYSLIFLSTVFAIFKMFPGRTQFTKNFESGKPWKYELLTAPFNFPIYKTDEEIKREKDSVSSLFVPYYIISYEASDALIERLRGDTTIEPNMRKQIANALGFVYKRGVLHLKDAEELSEAATLDINIADSSNVWRKTSTKGVFNVVSAYDYISKVTHISKPTLDSLKINNYLTENLDLDKNKSDIALKELLQNISLTKGMVQAGERIIDRGEIVTKDQFKILHSLKIEYDQNVPAKSNFFVDFGKIMLIAGLLFVFVLYMALFRAKFVRIKNAIFMTTMILMISGSAALILEINPQMIDVVPFALMVIIVRIFFDTRTALFVHTIIVLIVSLMLPSPYIFILLHIPAGMVAVSTLKQLTRRGQLVQSTFYVFLSYVLIYTFYTFVDTGKFFPIHWEHYALFLANSILLLFAYILIYIFEKIFGYLSDVTLMELSNINNKLLMEFSTKAPGSFQHVIQVSTLAATMAQKINANILLARTGALYHDIGKIKNAMCFTENQVSSLNPLNDMPFEEAAKIILAHVDDGVKIAEQNRLPKQIIDFIKSHHAKGVAKYFYISAKNASPEVEIDKSKYTYTGKYPTTKEEVLVMMADAAEAASKSLKEYSEQSISDLVDNIIASQIADQSYRFSPITFKNVETAKAVLKEKLLNIYHSRIEYPK